MLKQISNYFYYYDPTCEYLVKAWMMTLAVTASTLFLCFTHKPLTIIATIVPVFMVFITFSSPKYIDKIKKLFVYYLIYSFFAFFISIFHNHRVMIILIIFFTIYVIYSSNKIYYLASSAWVLGFLTYLPNGWYEGVNRVFEMSCCLVFSIVTIIIFEYFITRRIVYNTLKHAIELVNDIFNIHVSNEPENKIICNIKNKYLYKKDIAYRGELEVECILKNKKDMFYHRAYLAFSRLDIFIYTTTYIFYKNRRYVKAITKLYFFYRRLSREIEFLAKYKELNDLIKINFPETLEVVEKINEQLFCLYTAYLGNDYITHTRIMHDNLYKKWLDKYKHLTENNLNNINKEEIKIYFSIKNILYDMDNLISIFNNKLLFNILKAND